jgi:WASH complex subunit 7
MKEFNIRSQVAFCLNASFCNQPAVSIDDVRMREEMRSLAISKYGLPLAEDERPEQTVEGGIDALEVIREVHLFVSEYSYDFHSQRYVERANRSGLGIQQVSSSIRTHGIGFTHSVISSVHEYLTQRFQQFSQLLFDDKIRSVMAKESRTFRREQSGPKSFNGAATPAPSKDYSMVSIFAAVCAA